MLTNINYKGQKGKEEKKIGKAISKKIFNLLINDNPNYGLNNWTQKITKK